MNANAATLAPTRHRMKRWYIMFLIVGTFGTLGASLAVGLLIGYVNGLKPIERLEEYNPEQSTTILDRSGKRVIGEFSGENRHVVPFNEIPDLVKRAFLAIEDDRFYDHYGVDLKAAIRSFVANRKAGATGQGGSTITMQLPRNVIPEEVGREKKWKRKLDEVFLAFQIERRYSKDQILGFYLNHIPMGRNAFGIHAAADTYFSKELKDLTLAECATLAGIPRGPSLYNPIGNPKRSRRRRDLVLARMRDLKWISGEQYDRAVNTPLIVRPGKARTNAANSEFPYFVDGLQRDLTDFYQIPDEDLRQGGLTIQSSLEPRYQVIAQEELRKGLAHAEQMWNDRKPERLGKESQKLGGTPEAGQTRLMKIVSRPTTGTLEVALNGFTGRIEFTRSLPYYEPDTILKPGNLLDVKITGVDQKNRRIEGRSADTNRLQGSVVVLDCRSGEVLAMIGGDDFKDADNQGQFNRAVMGGKQAGSTVKPFFYAAALEKGYAPNDIILDAPITIPSYPVPYKPHNYENTFFGPTTLIEALEHSRNVSTVRLFVKMGVKRALPLVVRFDYRPSDTAWRNKFKSEVSVCLGTVDMNALELAAAYLVFTNRGIGSHPQFFKAITDASGREAFRPNRDESVVLDPVVAYQMLYILRQVVVGGTGYMAIGKKFPSPPYPPIIGKTGTTDDSAEAWFVGASPDLVICAYVGFDTPRSMGPDMTGGQVAGPIWANVFSRIFATRDDWKMEFDAPGGIERVNICAATGKRASASCSNRGHGIYTGVPYKQGEAPGAWCDGGVRAPVDVRTDELKAPEPTPVPAIDSEVLKSTGGINLHIPDA